MSKTITIIKLLNKIANGEEVPENIKYHNRNLKETDIMLCCKENIIDKLDCESIYLNDVVEIIEEQEEIDIQHILELNGSASVPDCIVKINQIINAVQQIEKELKEK